MSNRWFLLDAELANSFDTASMAPDEFRRLFLEALAGAENPFSRFIRGPYVRPPAHEWAALREQVFVRDDFRCGYCGVRGGDLECDHIYPVHLGGDNDPENLTTACRSCNRSKGGKTVAEWLN